MVVQAGGPYSTPTAFRHHTTIQSAGYAVTPYHVHVPTAKRLGIRPGALQTSRPPAIAEAPALHATWTSRCSGPRPCFPVKRRTAEPRLAVP